MLNLIFAPSADILAPLATDRIFGAWRDPFNPPAVVVPNPAVGKWLSVILAETPSAGCVANARMLTLERFLWNTLKPDQDTVLIDAGHLSQIVCALLGENILGDDAYKPIRDYLYGNLSIDPIKRVQLSARIARQFLEYEYNRPSVWNEEASRWGRHGIDAKWLSKKEYFEGREHEAWQMDLYRRVYECLSKNASPRYTTLPHLYRRKREECAKHKRQWCDVGSNTQIILFGVSKISHFHRNTLVEISQSAGVDMHVFLTNPCAEFWEDVDTSRRTRAPRRRWSNDSPDEAAGIKPVKPEDYDKQKLDMFADEEDHALLKLWGAAGKENIFLWCPQAQWNFEYHVGSMDSNAVNDDGVNGTTLLKAIQRSLLSRNNNLDFIDASTTSTPKDGSLLILACPDLSREVEEVRELILDMAHDNVIRCFDDIAVYIPDPNKYAPYIQRVFGAYPRSHPEYIPFTIIGASGGSNLTAKALSALFGIAGGEFNRMLIFELLENPIVMESKRFSRLDAERWERWASTFGMFRGYNAEQRELMGDVGSAVIDEHTFEYGMRRVSESAEMSDDGAKLSAELFMSLLGELRDLSAFFTGHRRLIDIRAAVETMRTAVWSWLGHISGDCSTNEAAEARVRRDVLNGLEQITLQYACANRSDMDNGEFLALARGCVPAEPTAPSTAWRGVTFAPLRASMILPHRAIFAMGLGAAEFPGTNETPGWDLLSSKRIVGDSDKVWDNRFAFLEMAHAAKERLILSYRARDMQKDEELQPSSVVLELEEYLIGQGLVDKKENSRKCSARRDVPWVIHEALETAHEAGRKHGSWDKEQRILATESLKERVKHRHDLAVNRDSSANGNQTVGTISSSTTADIRDLKQFLSNPLEYHLRKTLEIADDEDAVDMTEADEPLDSGPVNISALRRKVWINIINTILSDNTDITETDAEHIAASFYDEHVNSGHAPEGHICRMERKELIDWTMSCVDVCADTAGELRKNFSNHKLVENDEFPVICGDFTVNARLQITVIPKDPANKRLKTGIVGFDKDTKRKPEDNLNLWLNGIMMWLNEMRKGGERRPVALVALNHGDKPTIKVSDMKMNERKLRDTEKWLNRVLTQMLVDNRDNREHLPFEAVAGILKPDKKGLESYEERLQKLTADSLTDYLAGYYTFLKAFRLADAKPPEMSDDDLRRVANNRYAPILERWHYD